MLIKVCGMRDPDNIRAVAELGIDLMGLIFWDKSPRYVGLEQKLPTKYLEQKLSTIRQKFSSRNLKYVGVFVDEKLENVIARVKDYHLDYIQLHGNESAAYIDKLHEFLRPFDPSTSSGQAKLRINAAQDKFGDAKIIKAISIREADDVKRWREYAGHVDMLLFDTKCKCVGGSGEQFDWSVLEQYDGDIPFLLSGGIGPDDAERIKAFHHPMCIGIDLNSKFEDAPGLKNIDKLRNFINKIRN